MYKQTGETPVERDEFSQRLLALAAEYGHTDFVYSGYNFEGSTGSTIANVKDGVVFVTILYSLMMQFPQVYKLFLGVLVEMATGGMDFASAVGRKEKITRDEDLNDYIAKQQP